MRKINVIVVLVLEKELNNSVFLSKNFCVLVKGLNNVDIWGFVVVSVKYGHFSCDCLFYHISEQVQNQRKQEGQITSMHAATPSH